jgi:hypothetical protein
VSLGASPHVARAADGIHWTVTGQTSVTFDWRGDERTIEFGTTSGTYTRNVEAVSPSPMPNSSTGPYWEARITGLAENTLYFYRIGTGPEHTFRTPPPRGGSGFWIGVTADIGSSISYAGVVPNQTQLGADNPNIPGDDRPRLVVAPGDLTYGDDKGPAHVDRHFNDVMVWSQDAAYMPIWGNHEWGSSNDDLQNYEGRFDFPNTKTSPGAPSAGGPGDDWYWFDYGNVRFIAFPEPYSGAWSDWASKVDPIMAEAQNDAAIRFIVTFGHRPAWSSGSDHGGESSIATPLKNLRAKYDKLALNLTGHSHHYERTIPELTDGIVHIVAGGGGSSLSGLAVEPVWAASRAVRLHHLKLRFGADRIEGYTVCGPSGAGGTTACAPDEIIDRFTIMATGAPPPSDAAAPATTTTLRLR